MGNMQDVYLLLGLKLRETQMVQNSTVSGALVTYVCYSFLINKIYCRKLKLRNVERLFVRDFQWISCILFIEKKKFRSRKGLRAIFFIWKHHILNVQCDNLFTSDVKLNTTYQTYLFNKSFTDRKFVWYKRHCMFLNKIFVSYK